MTDQYQAATVDLLRRFLDKRPVIWVGAGASVAAGYPSTAQLIAALLEHSDTQLSGDGDFYDVVDAFVERHGNGELGALLDRLIGPPRPPTSLHRAIATLTKEGRVSGIITTNYDNLLERALDDASVHTVLQVLDQNLEFDGVATRLLKIHGDRSSWLDTIFSGNSYREFRKRYSRLSHSLSELLQRKRVLFVGCSLRDPRVLDWLDELDPNQRTALKDWRALMTRTAWDRARNHEYKGGPAHRLLDASRVRPYILAGHSQLHDLWEELAEQASDYVPSRKSQVTVKNDSKLRIAIAKSEMVRGGWLRLPSRQYPLADLYQQVTLLGSHEPEGVLVDARQQVSAVAPSFTSPDGVAAPQHGVPDRVSPMDALSQLSRILVVGPPGSGKSTLLQYLAWKMAARACESPHGARIPARFRLQDWERWDRVASPDGADLSCFLAEAHRRLGADVSSTQWRRWLEAGDVLLLLDGLDETSGSTGFRDHLLETLAVFPKCDAVATCRTDSVGKFAGFLREFATFAVEPLQTSQYHEYVRRFGALAGTEQLAGELLERLATSSRLRSFASSPLLLSILCEIHDHPVSVPTTRGGLYDLIVDRLLDRRARRRGSSDSTLQMPLARKRRVLEQTALLLVPRGDSDTTSNEDSEGQLLAVLTDVVRLEGLAHPATTADTLLVDYAGDAGLILVDGQRRCRFLHESFRDFLAGSNLARLVEDSGWESPISIGGVTCSISELVNRRAWDPRWHEVIVFMAGRLRRPQRVLRFLTSEPSQGGERDDVLRHRLILAAGCIPDVTIGTDEDIASSVGHVVAEVVSEIERDRTWRIDESKWPLRRAAMSLAQADRLVDGAPFVDSVCKRLPPPNAMRWIRLMVPLAATRPVIRLLREGLDDPDETVRTECAYTIADLGGSAAAPEILIRLREMLESKRWPDPALAAKALAGIGAAALTPELSTSLLKLIRKQHDNSFFAVKTLSGMGAAVVSEELFRELIRLIEDRSGSSDDAIRALGAIGTSAGTPEAIGLLVRCLRADGGFTRRCAAEAVGGIGPAAGTSEILLALADLLYDQSTVSDGRSLEGDDPMWNWAVAAKAIGRLGERATQPWFLTILGDMIESGRWDVGRPAMWAIGYLGEAAAEPGLLQRLSKLILDEEFTVKRAAMLATGGIGPAAGTPDIINALTRTLADSSSPDEQILAMDTIASIGPCAANDRILTSLDRLIAPGNWWTGTNAGDFDEYAMMRFAAVETVANLGPGAATPEILDHLPTILDHEDVEDGSYVAPRDAFGVAVKGLGMAAATANFLESLGQLVHGPHRIQSRAAVRALYESVKTPRDFRQLGDLGGAIGPARFEGIAIELAGVGLRMFTDEQGGMVCSSVAELSEPVRDV